MLSRFLIPRKVASLATCSRHFHSCRALQAIKPFLLADIGEGIKECEIIQWFVEPNSKVAQFDKICEVQSDKASVEITSRFDGVIKTLHYNAGDMAVVGKPLVDIDVDQEETSNSSPPSNEQQSSPAPTSDVTPHFQPQQQQQQQQLSSSVSLATPAVRRICRENNIDISNVPATGKDGRVLKEDVLRFLQVGNAAPSPPSPSSTPPHPQLTNAQDIEKPLTPIQARMFDSMTGSLSIPHFLYSDQLSLDSLVKVRSEINSQLVKQGLAKLSFMPFFIKAMSEALLVHPDLNSSVSTSNEGKPKLIIRASHNIGIAMDTPGGLMVPNIKNVANLSILEIGQELERLQKLGKDNKLSSNDLKDTTITISNIGNVGGTYLMPVIVTGQVAILALGRAARVPVFASQDSLQVVPSTQINMSWSADHRVIDGMSMANMASEWKSLIEQPSRLLARLR